MNRSDWLMLFLADSPQRAQAREFDPIRIQKGLFLFWKTAGIPDSEAYDFRAYSYGPLSQTLSQDVEGLVHNGAVQARPDDRGQFSHYRATPESRAVAREIEQRSEAKPYLLHLEVVRELLASLTFSQIVGGVYAAYPDYSVETTAPDLTPDGDRAPRQDIQAMFTPSEIAFRVDTLRGMRQIERGHHFNREQFRALLNGA